MKIFKIPKIIVMANFQPDYTKLSKDRYDVINLDPKITYESDESSSEDDTIKDFGESVKNKIQKPKLKKIIRPKHYIPSVDDDSDDEILMKQQMDFLLKLNPNLYS